VNQTALLDRLPVATSGSAIRFESDELTGHADYAGIVSMLLRDEYEGWPSSPGSARFVLVKGSHHRSATVNRVADVDVTKSLSIRPFEEGQSTGGSFADLLARAAETWRQHLLTEAEIVAVDAPEMLKAAREEAGLPVQDLAAMFGVKRRQFYNLLRGEDMPTSDRQVRIRLVCDAIQNISHESGGNSRLTRSAILAAIEGDSVFDAATAADAQRLEFAVARARAAVRSGQQLQRRTAPSHRADRVAAAAAREDISLSRDQMGYTPDES